VWFIGPEPKFAYAFLNAVAVLIIACPVRRPRHAHLDDRRHGPGRARGILFRNARRSSACATSTPSCGQDRTLTLGHPALTDFVADGIAEEEALALVAGWSSFPSIR